MNRYQIDRRIIEYFDWGLLFLTFFIIMLGNIVLYSAVNTGVSNPNIYMKQVTWYAIGFIGFLFLLIIDYRELDRWAYVIHAIGIILLMGVLLFGKAGGGARRWISIGSIYIQPSEFIKLSLIIVLSRLYSRRLTAEGLILKDLIVPIVITVIPAALIILQPDLGTAMLICIIALTITLILKIEKKLLLISIVTVIFVIPSSWSFLKEYQKKRILTFLNPDLDPLGAGYHIIQSKIAIGSGMITGKGMMKGTQNSLAFLPEQHTDFIFSVMAEEWGFIGASLTIISYLGIILLGLNIAYKCKDLFGTILAIGISALIFWQVVINIGMVMGLMPVVGIPLPLFSYGGSSTITMMACIGILMNIRMRRFMFE